MYVAVTATTTTMQRISKCDKNAIRCPTFEQIIEKFLKLLFVFIHLFCSFVIWCIEKKKKKTSKHQFECKAGEYKLPHLPPSLTNAYNKVAHTHTHTYCSRLSHYHYSLWPSFSMWRFVTCSRLQALGLLLQCSLALVGRLLHLRHWVTSCSLARPGSLRRSVARSPLLLFLFTLDSALYAPLSLVRGRA